MSVKLNLNQPVVMALKRTDGKFFESKFPGREGSVMYSVVLADGSEEKLFVPEGCSEAFRGLRPMEVFRITQRKTQSGEVYYEVNTSAAKTNGHAAQPQPEAPTPLESTLAASIAHVQAQKAATSATSTAPAPEQSKSSNMAADLVAASLIAAIDGLLTAMEYARSKGIETSLDLEFNAEDVRCLAATTYIQASKSPLYDAAIAVKPNGGLKWSH
jgi:hypothetical protein